MWYSIHWVENWYVIWLSKLTKAVVFTLCLQYKHHITANVMLTLRTWLILMNDVYGFLYLHFKEMKCFNFLRVVLCYGHIFNSIYVSNWNQTFDKIKSKIVDNKNTQTHTLARSNRVDLPNLYFALWMQ